MALSAIHNFICTHEPGEEAQQGNPDVHHDVNDHLNEDPAVGIVDREEVDVQCDKIAQDMWNDYLRVCEEQGIVDNMDESPTLHMMRRRIELVNSFA